MGATAVHHLEQVLDNSETIIAIELLCAAQGIDFRKEALSIRRGGQGRGTSVAYLMIRKEVPFLDSDVVLAPLIERVRQIVHNGSICKEVVKAIGEKERF